MKRIGRQLMALGVLGLIVTFVVGASGPGPELQQQIGVAGALAVFALGGGFLLWLIGIVFGSEGKRAPAPVTVAGPATSWVVEPSTPGKPAAVDAATLKPRLLPGGHRVEVVGESHYVPALDTIADDGLTQAWADLVLEDDNPYDRGAVRVEIDGEKVGYLSRDIAPTYRPVGLRLRELGYVGRCAATIKGNERRRLFGVFLDLASPDVILKDLKGAPTAATT